MLTAMSTMYCVAVAIKVWYVTKWGLWNWGVQQSLHLLCAHGPKTPKRQNCVFSWWSIITSIPNNGTTTTKPALQNPLPWTSCFSRSYNYKEVQVLWCTCSFWRYKVLATHFSRLQDRGEYWPKMEGTMGKYGVFSKEEDPAKVFYTWSQVKSHKINVQDARFTVTKSSPQTALRSSDRIPQFTCQEAPIAENDEEAYKWRRKIRLRLC